MDTIRILVSWRCILNCWYCCNRQERFRQQIRPVSLDEIRWDAYQTVCITGGEPLLFPDRIRAVCERVPAGTLIVLYTNGLLLDPSMARDLVRWGVRAVNVGLHVASSFEYLIARVRQATAGLDVSVRFHVRDTERWLAERHPEVEFRFWKLDDCDRENEDRVVLQDFGRIA